MALSVDMLVKLSGAMYSMLLIDSIARPSSHVAVSSVILKLWGGQRNCLVKELLEPYKRFLPEPGNQQIQFYLQCSLTNN